MILNRQKPTIGDAFTKTWPVIITVNRAITKECIK